jgi:hypothetical protein
MIEASTQFMVGRLSTESGKCNRFNLDGIFGNDRSHYVRVLLILGQPNAGVQRRAKRVRCNSLFGGVSVNSTVVQLTQ